MMWKTEPFNKVITSHGVGNAGLQKKHWKKSGKFPVIGQGENYIEGWSNNKDMVINPSKGLVLYGGHTRRAKHVSGPFIPGPNVKVLTPVPELNSKFLYYFLNHVQIPNKGYADHFPLVRRISIPIPPMKEQEKMVSILEEADELKRKRIEADQKMTEIIIALFNDIFGDESKWPKRKLGDLSEFKYGTSVKCDYDSRKIPVLRIPNVLGGEIVLDDLKYGHLESKEKEKLLLQKGDLLFVRTNGNPDYVGRCAPFGLGDSYTFASYLIRARLNTEEIDPIFISAYLNTKMGRNTMLPAIRTTAGQSNINTQGLSNIKISIPPIELQKEFANKIREIKNLTSTQKISSVKIEELFSAVLTGVFK